MRVMLKAVSKVLIVILVVFAFTMVSLQALHKLPAGNSPVKTLSKSIVFFGGAVWFFLVAATQETFRWRDRTPMPLWLGRAWCLACGGCFFLAAVLVTFGILS
jgi:hypothetical protein